MDRLFPKTDPEGLKRLLETPDEELDQIDYLRKCLAAQHATPMPCPMCFDVVNLYDAGDDTQEVGVPYAGSYACPNCDTELIKFTPFFLVPDTPGWHWRRKHPLPGKKQGAAGT